MTTAETSIRAPFTYIWIIENCSELTYMNLKSPLFLAPSISKYEWYLNIDENFDFCCSLRSENAPREENAAIDIEISLLAADGSPVISKKSDRNSLWIHLLNRASFLKRWNEFLQNRTLTVQCRMWRKGIETSTADLCYARTKLKANAGSFVWSIKEFSAFQSCAAEDFRDVKPSERKIYTLKPCTEKGPFNALVLYLKQNSESEDVYVDFLIEKGRDYAFSCELSVLDANGEIIHTHEERGLTYFSWAILRFCPLISKNKLIANKKLFLQNDTLVLKCSFEVCRGVMSNEIEYCTQNVSSVVKEEEEVLDFFVEEMDACETLEFEEYFIKEMDETDSRDEYSLENGNLKACKDSCSLKVALKHLQSEAILSDSSLRIGAKLYPVHKNILSSRSPVFSTVFSKDMKQNIVEIDSMDENTLSLLLLYTYADEIEDLHFAKAVELFKAASDYQILGLKSKCSEFLVANLSRNNTRDLLSMAKKYQDEKLEVAARNFGSGRSKKLKIFKGSKKSAECTVI